MSSASSGSPFCSPRHREEERGAEKGKIKEIVLLISKMVFFVNRKTYTGRASMPAWWSKKEVGQENSKLAVMAANRMELLIKVLMLRSNN